MAVSPGRARTGPIVLATDFGLVSEAAERVAIRDAARAGKDLVVVHAIDARRLRLPGGRWRSRLDQTRAQRERDAALLVEMARTSGVDARVLIWTGDPATCVVDAARAEDAAWIVVGSHGRGPIGRILAGSISQAVAHLADCPVAVVTSDAATSWSRHREPDGPLGRAIGPITGRGYDGEDEDREGLEGPDPMRPGGI